MSLLNQPFDPTREAALVTGVGNGIGRAIAQALSGEGVRTIFADVNGQTIEAAVKSSPRPDLAIPFVGDLADRAACEALLAEADRRMYKNKRLRKRDKGAATAASVIPANVIPIDIAAAS